MLARAPAPCLGHGFARRGSIVRESAAARRGKTSGQLTASRGRARFRQRCANRRRGGAVAIAGVWAAPRPEISATHPTTLLLEAGVWFDPIYVITPPSKRLGHYSNEASEAFRGARRRRNDRSWLPALSAVDQQLGGGEVLGRESWSLIKDSAGSHRRRIDGAKSASCDGRGRADANTKKSSPR